MSEQTQFETMSNDELLARFLETRDQEMKRELVLRYVYIVKTIAMQMRGVYVSLADMDDIVNEGIIALMDALDKFDPSKNVKFVSYASLRIRGAVIDFARKQDWMPRNVRRTAREIDNASGQLHMQLGRSPTEQEMAAYLEMDLKKYRKALKDTSLYSLLSLDAMIDESQSEWRFQPVGGGGRDEDPDGRLQSQELYEALKEAVASLKPREQLEMCIRDRSEDCLRGGSGPTDLNRYN